MLQYCSSFSTVCDIVGNIDIICICSLADELPARRVLNLSQSLAANANANAEPRPRTYQVLIGLQHWIDRLRFSVSQSVKTHLYSAVCRERIRGTFCLMTATKCVIIRAQFWLAMLKAISDPYCQAVSVAMSVCLSAAWLVPYRQCPRYAAKLAASQAMSPTGLSCLFLLRQQ